MFPFYSIILTQVVKLYNLCTYHCNACEGGGGGAGHGVGIWLFLLALGRDIWLIFFSGGEDI